MEANAVAYPVRFTFDPPERIARWRPLLSWLLVIPHVFVLWVLQIAAGVCMFIAWFVILFTGKMPETLGAFVMVLLRYQTRVTTYLLFLQEEYPPFEYPNQGADPGTYPRTRVDVDVAFEGRNRLTVFFRYLLVIPHSIVLAFVGIAAGIALMIAWFAVLITAKWPEGLRTFVLGYLRWSTRVYGYAYLLTDEYPPFSLD